MLYVNIDWRKPEGDTLAGLHCICARVCLFLCLFVCLFVCLFLCLFVCFLGLTTYKAHSTTVKYTFFSS